MSQNLISWQLKSADLADIQKIVKTLNDRLDFLIDLSADERRSLTKTGDRSRAFVERALEVSQNHSEILPRRFDIDEFANDVALHKQLSQLRNSLIPLLEKLDDTALAAGSDAYSAALEVYGYAKAAGAGEGLDELCAAMGRRFKRQSRRKSSLELV